MSKGDKPLNVEIPFLNEEGNMDVLNNSWLSVINTLTNDFEVIFVDGSKDGSFGQIQSMCDKKDM